MLRLQGEIDRSSGNASLADSDLLVQHLVPRLLAAVDLSRGPRREASGSLQLGDGGAREPSSRNCTFPPWYNKFPWSNRTGRDNRDQKIISKTFTPPPRGPRVENRSCYASQQSIGRRTSVPVFDVVLQA